MLQRPASIDGAARGSAPCGGRNAPAAPASTAKKWLLNLKISVKILRSLLNFCRPSKYDPKYVQLLQKFVYFCGVLLCPYTKDGHLPCVVAASVDSAPAATGSISFNSFSFHTQPTPPGAAISKKRPFSSPLRRKSRTAQSRRALKFFDNCKHRQPSPCFVKRISAALYETVLKKKTAASPRATPRYHVTRPTAVTDRFLSPQRPPLSPQGPQGPG